MRQTLLLSLLLLAAVAPAAKTPVPPLSEYSCVRPQPWEEGALQNVSIAASLINGQQLAPGEHFSFNHAMEAGLDRFVEGTSYASGRVVTSDGGGICQVSSALYNAVVLAGLEVLERRNHSLYDPSAAYVPAGRDAMVTRVGRSDFRFRNSTAAPLRIQAWAEGGKVNIRLLGRQHRRKQRWIESEELDRRPFELLQKEDDKLAPGERKQLSRGFDGLTIKSRVCWADSEGQTHCASLGTDEYLKVDERWKSGPSSAAAAP
jgi:vancomycin resistance protein YoaR